MSLFRGVYHLCPGAWLWPSWYQGLRIGHIVRGICRAPMGCPPYGPSCLAQPLHCLLQYHESCPFCAVCCPACTAFASPLCLRQALSSLLPFPLQAILFLSPVSLIQMLPIWCLCFSVSFPITYFLNSSNLLSSFPHSLVVCIVLYPVYALASARAAFESGFSGNHVPSMWAAV